MIVSPIASNTTEIDTAKLDHLRRIVKQLKLDNPLQEFHVSRYGAILVKHEDKWLMLFSFAINGVLVECGDNGRYPVVPCESDEFAD